MIISESRHLEYRADAYAKPGRRIKEDLADKTMMNKLTAPYSSPAPQATRPKTPANSACP